MKLMKNLLLATDLSARSDRAFERAVALAQQLSAKLTVVHVIDEELPASIADAQADVARQTIQDQIDKISGGTVPSFAIEVVFGRAYADILEISEKLDAELIVMGIHRDGKFKEMYRGTTAERVIRAGNCPILVVKDRITGPYSKIMIGVDFSVYSRRAIEFAVNFVADGEFHLVHAYDVPFRGFLSGESIRQEMSKQHQMQFQEMIDSEMAAFLSGLGEKAPKFKRVMQEGMVREVIHEQIRRLNPDLLVIGTHGRTGVAHAFLGSVAEDLLADPPCDVLAVKAW